MYEGKGTSVSFYFFLHFYKINLLILKNSVHVYNEMQPYFLPSNFPYVPIHKFSWFVCLFIFFITH